MQPAQGGTTGAFIELHRYDLAIGLGALVGSWPSAVFAAGLDALPDGRLVAIDNNRDLWFIDPLTLERTVVTAAAPVGFLSSVVGMAVDERGALVTNSAGGTRRRLDPLDGALLPLQVPSVFGGQSLEIDMDGAAYVGGIDGSITRHRAGAAPLRILVNNGVPGPLRGLALRRPANDWAGDLVCPGTPNSTGKRGRLELLGSRLLAVDELSVRARDLPPLTTAAFAVGPVVGFRPLGAGFLCVDLPAALVPQTLLATNAAGACVVPLPPSSAPIGAPATAGDTLVFQLWHRDVDLASGSPTVNFSGAVRVVFR